MHYALTLLVVKMENKVIAPAPYITKPSADMVFNP